jgi:hypothetical protein
MEETREFMFLHIQFQTKGSNSTESIEIETQSYSISIPVYTSVIDLTLVQFMVLEAITFMH